MTQTFTRSLSATAAISAVLALGSTAALAQEAAPSILAPPPASAPAVATAPSVSEPAPSIILPNVGATATAAAPTASPSAEPVAVSPAEPSASSTTRGAKSTSRRSASTSRAEAAPTREAPRASAAAQAPRAAPRPAISAPAETPRASSANILNDASTRPAAPQDIARNTAVEPAASSTATSEQSNDGIPGDAIAGVLAALGIGAVGYAAMRSRRRRIQTGDESMVSAPLEAEATREEALPRTVPAFGTAGQAFDTPRPAAPDMRYGFAPARGQASDAAVIEREPMAMAPVVAASRERSRSAYALPSEVPEDADARSAMIDRMVDAEPDDANPFTSRKARRKRARLLLQNTENEARPDVPFDWRTYRSQTQRTTPASPELVTA